MPRTRSLAFAELKLGLIAVLAIVLAGALIFAVGGGGFFWQRYPLKTTFANVAGIKSGSPVRIAGIEKGSVSGVEFAGTGVEVWFNVEKDMRRLDHDRLVRLHRVHLTAGRGRYRHHGGANGHTHPRLGLRAIQAGSRQHRRAHPSGDRRPRRGEAPDSGHPGGTGHRWQALHRRGRLSRHRPLRRRRRASDECHRVRGGNAWPADASTRSCIRSWSSRSPISMR